MDCVILLRLFVFSLLCCKYMYDTYLNMLDFNGLCKFNDTFIYKITEYIQAVSQRRNYHMQVSVIIMKGK